MSSIMTTEMVEQELQLLKKGIKFFQKNRGVLIERMAEMDLEKDEELLKEYEDAVLRLDYAVHGLKRMLADGHNAKREQRKSVVGAARFHKEMWERERRSLQKRVGEQRRQLEWLIVKNRELREIVQNMLNGRVQLLAAIEAQKEDIAALRHSWPDGHMCEGCPKEEGCLHQLDAGNE